MSAFSERIRANKTGFFKVADLENIKDKELTFTISRLDEECEMFNKTVDLLNFEETGQQLQLNQTTSEWLLDAFGDNPETYPGKRVTLYLGEYEYQKKKRRAFASSCPGPPPLPPPQHRRLRVRLTPRPIASSIAKTIWTTQFLFDAGTKPRKPIEPVEPDPGPGWLRSRFISKTRRW